MNIVSHTRRLVSLLLMLLLAVVGCVYAHADGFDTSESDMLDHEYQTIAQFSASLSITGSIAKCVGRVTMKEYYSGTLRNC